MSSDIDIEILGTMLGEYGRAVGAVGAVVVLDFGDRGHATAWFESPTFRESLDRLVKGAPVMVQKWADGVKDGTAVVTTKPGVPAKPDLKLVDE